MTGEEPSQGLITNRSNVDDKAESRREEALRCRKPTRRPSTFKGVRARD